MVVQELVKNTFQKKWVKFGLVPFIGLLGLFFIINSAIITYQNNHITEADKEYVEWFNEHYEEFSAMDESIDQLSDDFQTYRDNHNTFQRDSDLFLSKAFGVYPELVNIYNDGALLDLIEEAEEHPMPDNRKLKSAHKTYLYALEGYRLYAATLIEFIQSDADMEKEADMMRYRLTGSGTHNAFSLVNEIDQKID